MKKVLILLTMLLMLPVISFAYDYEIKSYDVNVVVNESNVFDITEKIGTVFNVNKHGIFRKLPLSNTVKRLDGTVSKNRAIVSNVNVNEPFSLSQENGYQVIKVGDANRTIKGEKDYTINYSYNIGNDTGKDYDELYLNIIGTEWDTTIENISFSVTMPKEFDKENAGFSVGRVGSTKNDGIKYSINGNTIVGSYAGKLNPGDGLTIRVELPEGYFLITNNTSCQIILLIIPILFTLIVIALWYKFGRDEKPVETVEFYPPENLNSAETGYLYKGKVEDNDIVSLLIYLANKGYIKIVEEEKSGLFATKNTFRIVGLKEYDGNNEIERRFFSGLFKKRVEILVKEDEEILNDKRESISESELKYSFYKVLSEIKSTIMGSRKKIFDKNASIAKVVSMIMLIGTFLSVMLPIVYAIDPELLFILLFPMIGFPVMFALIFGKTPISAKIVGLIWGGGFAGIPTSIIIKAIIANNPKDIKVITFGIICVVIIGIFAAVMDKRTKYGTEMLGRIRGFKNFLETAEKEKLEFLVMESPTYFYDILPYTYVLGVSNKWINKFESIAYEAPSWYEGNNTFTMIAFGSFINNTMRSAGSAMTSQPSSSSGGFSGGGFSGGGSGGGGGGSW